MRHAGRGFRQKAGGSDKTPSRPLPSLCATDPVRRQETAYGQGGETLSRHGPKAHVMKLYLASLAVGVLVGVLYALVGVRSPAPPVVALLGLLGMLAGEQLPDAVRQALKGEWPTLGIVSRPAAAPTAAAPTVPAKATDGGGTPPVTHG